MAVHTLASVVDCTKLEITPPVTVMSLASNPVGTALKVNVTTAVPPAVRTVLSLVINTPGAVTAVNASDAAVPRLPAVS